jgi:c-di-AMP phosphodiesterase-like protein
MGHRYGDFDSFGASVGMVRLAKVCGVEAHIVVNRSDANLLECFDRMEALEDYEDVFISATDAMDHLHSDTLVVLVDVNNYEHAESPAILRAAQKNIVIIDHHNQRAEFPSPPLLAYIEPSASSASELVGEILEQHMTSSGRILKEEAEMMLSGILLDTKRFSRSTGTRTFSVALYLRGEGANPGEANELFKTEVGDLIKEARFNSHVVIYRDQIALSVCDGEADSSYRVVAAKAADKLLGVRGVHASFAMVKIGEKIHISARSDGSINVQVIMEQLHGGGHFDVAGAQVEGDSVQAVISKLKEAIDKFVD